MLLPKLYPVSISNNQSFLMLSFNLFMWLEI